MKHKNSFLKRVWADVSLDDIKHNYSVIRKLTSPNTKIMAIVKADGYGHGAVQTSRVLSDMGADLFGVSNLDEARQLRHGGITAPILILGYTPYECAPELIEYDIMQTVYTYDAAKKFSDAAEWLGKKLTVHLKIDTGMSRLGMMYQDKKRDAGAIDEAVKIYSLPGLEFNGIFTHFAVADEDAAFTRRQFDLFMYFCNTLEGKGIDVGLRHCCNSAGLINYPDMHLDIVRPGIILYGLPPDNKLESIEPFGLRPAMELKTAISYIKEIDENTPVSYGRIYTAPKKVRLATLPIGYADGFSRIFSNGADVLINGCTASVVGRVCMDQCMVDVSNIEGVDTSCIVTIFGHDGEHFISACKIAEYLGTIGYEVICQIGKRVPRVYILNGHEAGYLNYIEGGIN